MSKQFWVFLVVGLLVMAVAVVGMLYWTRGEHIELKGSILKVRVQEMDERSAVAVLDFRFVNPSDYVFVVRTVTVTLEDGKGNFIEGRVSSSPTPSGCSSSTRCWGRSSTTRSGRATR